MNNPTNNNILFIMIHCYITKIAYFEDRNRRLKDIYVTKKLCLTQIILGCSRAKVNYWCKNVC